MYSPIGIVTNFVLYFLDAHKCVPGTQNRALGNVLETFHEALERESLIFKWFWGVLVGVRPRSRGGGGALQAGLSNP